MEADPKISEAPEPAPVLRKPEPGPPIPWDPVETKSRPPVNVWHTFQRGNADGILFLNEISERYLQGDQIVNEIQVEGTLRQALPFLRAPDAAWYKRNPGKVGHTHERAYRVIFARQPALIQAELFANARRQSLACILLTDCPGAVDCVQPAHVTKWRLESTEVEGVWAAFYEPLRK